MKAGKAGTKPMALITIEGVYENGRVELAQHPEGANRAKVMVTFLTETSAGRTKPVRKGGVSQGQDKSTPVAGERYPQTLRDEYKALIHKKLHRSMTAEEAVRLETVRAEINRMDRQSESWTAQEQRAAEV